MKIKVLSLILILFALFLCSCEEPEGTPEQKKYDTINLNVYNWGEYISDEDDEEYGLFDVNAGFEEYFNENLADKYGFYVKVNYSTYATNEDMFAKLSNSAVAYDIVIPSDYMIQKMIAHDMLLPLDYSILTNYGNISDEFKGLHYDPEDKFSVPYTYGMVGVIYNKNLVDPEDYECESWGLLWNEKYTGKILQFNNPRDAFGTAMYYSGLDINSTSTADWDAALEVLKTQKPLVQGYVNDEIFNKMTTASAAIAPYYAGDYLTMLDLEDALGFYYPTEGTNYFVDAMCIPKNAANPELAKEYINFMLSEEAAVANALYIGYASPNTLVQNSDYYKDEMGEDAIEILYGISPAEVNASYNAMYGTACYKSFTPEIQAYTNMLWESLKTENSTELWVHVTAIAIVVGVVAYAAYTTVIKKRRSKDYRLRDRENAKAKMAKKA